MLALQVMYYLTVPWLITSPFCASRHISPLSSEQHGRNKLAANLECGQEAQSMSICLCDLRICKKTSSPPCKFCDKIREFWTVHAVTWLLSLLSTSGTVEIVYSLSVLAHNDHTYWCDQCQEDKRNASAFTSVGFLVDYWLVCHGTMPPRVTFAWLHFLLARHIPWNYAELWTMLCSSKRDSTNSEGRRLLWWESSTPHLCLLDTFGKDYHQLTSPTLSSWRSDITPLCKGNDESVRSYCNF